MNGSDLRELEALARDVAWNLGEVWDRRTGRPSSLNLLDALVASGVTLVRDEDGIASACLFTRSPRVAA